MTLAPGLRAKVEASYSRLYIIFTATDIGLSICKSQTALSYEDLYDAINICVFLKLTCWSPALVQVEQSLCIQKQGLSGSELGHKCEAQFHSTGSPLRDNASTSFPLETQRRTATYKPKKRGTSEGHLPWQSLLLDLHTLNLWEHSFLTLKSPTVS